MQPQYLAPRASSKQGSDADESQARLMKTATYLLHSFSGSFGLGYTQVTPLKNTRGFRMFPGISRVEKTYRRLTCLRASKAFAPFPCWSSWQHVATTLVTLKNSWSLTQFQCLLSQRSQARTKVITPFSRQAFSPASHHHQPHQFYLKEAE